MNPTKKPRHVSRREFLRALGLTGAALAAFPLDGHASFLFKGGAPRIGVMLPPSSMHPLLGENTVAGMQTRLAECGWEKTELLLEQVHPGNVLPVARKLVTESKVDILVGMLNPRVVPQLRSLIEEAGVLFINLEGGANAFAPREESPFIYHNSFGYWQSGWALASWAAENVGKRAFVAASLYETGYDSYYAFPAAFAAAGGRIVGSALTPPASEAGKLSTLIAAIRRASPDFVYANCCGREAVDFVRAYAAAGLQGKIPLLASAFMLEEPWLREMGSAALGTISCASWGHGIASEENEAFIAAFRAHTGRRPDPFALLGYDTASLITEAVKRVEATARSSADLKRGLETVTLTSPRGRLGIDPQTGAVDAPLYLRQTKQVGNALLNGILTELPRFSTVAGAADLTAITAKSGWTNSYLCA